MYVQCERCKTEYDFDDALVSERGTTVKCTTCGHQFKLRRSATGAHDRWTVSTRTGETLVFTTLRELQKAIIAKQVYRHDLFSRGDGPPRALSSIAELEPFFDERRSSRPPPAELKGLAPVLVGALPAPRAPTATSPGLSPPNRSRTDTLRPPAGLGAAVPPPPVPRLREPTSPFAQTVDGPGATRPDRGRLRTPAPPEGARVVPPVAAVAMPESATPTARHAWPDPDHARNALSDPDEAPRGHSTRPAPVIVQAQVLETSSPLAPRVDSMNPGALEPGSLLEQRPRRRMGGWVMAFVLFVGIAVLVAVVAKPYLSTASKAGGSARPLDPKVEALVTDGEREMGAGNLDSAKESFDKASALAEKDPRVLLDVARLAAIVADVAWLDARLGPSPGSEEGKAKRRRLEELGVKARRAADDALVATPDDLGAVRVKIDALRIMGDHDGARALAPRLSPVISQPDTAYVLAALDLSEPAPPYPSVVERLRAAAVGDGNLGRAQALLVRALMESGDLSGAGSELGKLARLPRAHPLLGTLRTALEHASPAAVAGQDGAAPVAVVDVSALPSGSPVPAGGGRVDVRTLITQADAAKNRGEYERAKTLYGQVLERDPNDSEALAGLGDVSHRTSDLPNALAYYKRALAVNQSFVPALIGQGDVQWEQGDKASAQKTYREIVDRFPDSAYPGYVKKRLEGGGGGGAPRVEDAGEPP